MFGNALITCDTKTIYMPYRGYIGLTGKNLADLIQRYSDKEVKEIFEHLTLLNPDSPEGIKKTELIKNAYNDDWFDLSSGLDGTKVSEKVEYHYGIDLAAKTITVKVPKQKLERTIKIDRRTDLSKQMKQIDFERIFISDLQQLCDFRQDASGRWQLYIDTFSSNINEIYDEIIKLYYQNGFEIDFGRRIRFVKTGTANELLDFARKYGINTEYFEFLIHWNEMPLEKQFEVSNDYFEETGEALFFSESHYDLLGNIPKVNKEFGKIIPTEKVIEFLEQKSFRYALTLISKEALASPACMKVMDKEGNIFFNEVSLKSKNLNTMSEKQIFNRLNEEAMLDLVIPWN